MIQDPPAVATARPLPMRFRDYLEFKAFLWDAYEPLPEEAVDPALGFVAGTNMARRSAPRYFRALRAIREFTREGARLLDIGAYPGSFVRLARACYGAGLEITACGMPVTAEFARRLGREGIDFLACNLDPDLIAPAEMPHGLPVPDNSLEIITGMEVVEHLYSLRTILTECYRVLRPGGVAYLTTNNVMDRVGLLRIFREAETNLDAHIDETSIWSDYTNQWRGHVRFYSLKQLCRAAARAGLTPLRSGYFQAREDPDVIPWPDAGPLTRIRRWLRGTGATPPIELKTLAASALVLGPRSLAPRFHSHLEVVFQKPAT